MRLLEHIDSLGHPEYAGERITPVVTVVELLKDSGIDENLLKEIQIAVDYLSPLGTLVLADLIPEEELINLEGRGIYHSFPFHGRTMHMYAKGIGSAFAINPEAVFPGYPNDPTDTKKYFIDSYSRYFEKSRIYGMLSISQAKLEMIEAVTIFIQLAKKYKWTTLNEVIDAGVSLPLIIFSFNELSDDAKQKLSSVYPDGKWSSINMGSILSITPSSRRVLQSWGIQKDRGSDDYYENSKNPKVAYTCGATLRTLLDLGYVYELGSNHAQNLYAADHAICAQADSGDLLCLGEAASPSTQLDLVFTEICDKYYEDNMTLAWKPVEGKVTYEEAIESQVNFLSGLLGENVPEQILHTLAQLMMVARNEVMLAISSYLTENADKQIWNETKRTHRAIYEKIKDSEVTEQFHEHVRDAMTIHGFREKNITKLVTSSESLTKEIIDLLNGNNTQQLPSSRIAVRLNILKDILSLPPNERPFVLKNTIRSASEYQIANLSPDDNPLYYMDEKIFRHLSQLVKTNPQEAISFMDLIGLITKRHGHIILEEDETEYTYIQKVINGEHSAKEVYEYLALTNEANNFLEFVAIFLNNKQLLQSHADEYRSLADSFVTTVRGMKFQGSYNEIVFSMQRYVRCMFEYVDENSYVELATKLSQIMETVSMPAMKKMHSFIIERISSTKN